MNISICCDRCTKPFMMWDNTSGYTNYGAIRNEYQKHIRTKQCRKELEK